MTRSRWSHPLVLALLVVIPAMGARANATRDSNLLWPKVNGTVAVPYVLDASLTAGARTAFKNAVTQFTSKTCVRLVPRTTEANYLNVSNTAQGCYSYVGNIKKGAQVLSLGTGCEFTGTAVHQLMHALGFYDEQQRPDRDQYVTINMQNVVSGATSDFSVCTNCTTLNLPYDYTSIMQMGAKAYSANGQPTLVAKKAGVTLVDPSAKPGLTALDVKKILALYQCP